LAIDEELSLLEDYIRRLKVEYDIYLAGVQRSPTVDIEWKVRNLLRLFADGSRMSYSQRFLFSTLQQNTPLQYAVGTKTTNQRKEAAAGPPRRGRCWSLPITRCFCYLIP
jgi:hypothetical protein